MQIASTARRLFRVPDAPFLIYSVRFLVSGVHKPEDHYSSHHGRNQRSFSAHIPHCSGITHGIRFGMIANAPHLGFRSTCSVFGTAYFASEAEAAAGKPTDAVKELYDKMLRSVKEVRTMPPNAWLWSLIKNCANQEDIKLLFGILEDLRRFRLSNLRIHANFNENLCRAVTEACGRVGALEFGKKSLWKRNVYGLTPSIGSAHHLLLYAKEQNDVKLMVEIMKLLKRNDLPLQPGTADIVFSICYNASKWELLEKYSKKFNKAGVKLRRTTFDTWMKFAAEIGDSESIWKIENLRLNSYNQHTLSSGFSCAKAFLLENKPDSAAAIVQALNQNLPDVQKQGIELELKKLVKTWPSKVVNHHKKDDEKVLAASLERDIKTMLDILASKGLVASVNLEDLTEREAISC